MIPESSPFSPKPGMKWKWNGNEMVAKVVGMELGTFQLERNWNGMTWLSLPCIAAELTWSQTGIKTAYFCSNNQQ